MNNLSSLLGIDSRRSSMTLIEYKFDHKERASVSKYLVSHSSRVQKTTLEQYVTVERDRYGKFAVSVALDDFPGGLSDRESMLKLADWLHRLGVAIENEWSKPNE
ncbi:MULTISPECIES: hypothetical protein [unclassified Cedecea]|uniref:hypothetical protein n=1 Tax=unclassified Cedecea TaxID=2649846 RepID=UPI003018BCDD